MRAHVVVGLAVLAIAAFFGAGLPFLDSQGGYAGLSPRTFPILITVGLAACGLLLVIRHASVPAVAEDAADVQPHFAGFAWVAAGLLLDMALIGLIGFVLASVLLMVCVARGYGSRRPLRDALVALALTLPLWALFAKVLGISLPLLPIAGI